MTDNNNFAPPSLFNDPLFSDVKIIQICGEKQVEYYGHRAILSANSRWFYNAFKGPYAEAKESATKVLDDDPDTFRLMLKFIYDSHLSIEDRSTVVDASEDSKRDLDDDHLTFCCKLHAVAEKYLVPKLITETEKWFSASVVDCCNPNLELPIKVYYESCLTAGTPIGNDIATKLLSNTENGIEAGSPSLPTLIQQSPMLGADIMLVGMRKNLIQKASILTCGFCDAQIMIAPGWAMRGYCYHCGDDSNFGQEEEE